MEGERRGEWRTPPGMWEKLKPLAREMRQQPTAAEDAVWQALRGGRLGGFKFRRQHPIERFIVDFYCREARLVVEADGPTHDIAGAEDTIRTAYLQANGLTILRFRNEDVLTHLEAVLATLEAQLLLRPLRTPLSVDGEGPGGEV